MVQIQYHSIVVLISGTDSVPLWSGTDSTVQIQYHSIVDSMVQIQYHSIVVLILWYRSVPLWSGTDSTVQILYHHGVVLILWYRFSTTMEWYRFCGTDSVPLHSGTNFWYRSVPLWSGTDSMVQIQYHYGVVLIPQYRFSTTP